MYSTPGRIITCTEATTVDSESCQICSSCTDTTPSTDLIPLRTASSETCDGTPCMRMYEADLTVPSARYHKAVRLNIPSGRAEEKMMQVMKSDTPGSKYNVHLPSKNQMTRPAEMTPTFPSLIYELYSFKYRGKHSSRIT